MNGKKALKILLCAALALVLAAGGYLAYVLLTYYRLPDNQALAVNVLYKGGILTDGGNAPATRRILETLAPLASPSEKPPTDYDREIRHILETLAPL